MIKRIIVFGAGYVGTSLAVLLAKKYEVKVVDINEEKVQAINNKTSPIADNLITEYIETKELNLCASSSYKNKLLNTDLVILALPTNYEISKNSFNTKILEDKLHEFNKVSFKGIIIIKSTVPIGFTMKMNKLFPNLRIVFVPEFLREGKALEDNMYPSRIILGDSKEKVHEIAELFLNIAENNPKVLFMSSSEAEAVKLFANTYLALRVSFFNELDTFALEQNFNTRNIIDGISSDPRIGQGYHNPSFGYGGYCLPKDTKQLLASYETIPQKIFTAIIDSNKHRKDYLANKILDLNPNTVGVFRLVMKKGSDNFRDSAIFDLIAILKEKGKKIIVFEPLLANNNTEFLVTDDLRYFKKVSDIILANRVDESLNDVLEKVFTRDVYGEN